MKKRLLQRAIALFLIFVTVFVAAPFMCGFEAHAAMPTKKQVYKKLISMKKSYPEGKRWDDYIGAYNNDYDNGSGCYAFALLMSDAAFGKKLAYTKHKNLNDLKVGDIVCVNNNNHYVVVLKKGKKTITIAEGNYKGRIHWNRKLSIKKLKKDKKLYILTRYFWKDLNIKAAPDSVELSWPKLTKSQRKKISGIAVIRNGKVIKKLPKTATSYIDTKPKLGTVYCYQLKTYKKAASTVKYSNESPVKELFFMGENSY